MDENRDSKRRHHFFDMWSKKKQTGPRETRQSGILLARNKKRQQDGGRFRNSYSSSSSSSHLSDSESSLSRAEKQQYRPSFHQKHSTENGNNKFSFHSHQSPTHSKPFDRYEEQNYPNHYSDKNYSRRLYDYSIDLHTCSREQLFTFSPRKLRELCLNLGLDNRQSQKADLVETIYNHIHPYAYKSHQDILSAEKTKIETAATTHDDLNQMTILLREIIPFYGQGDTKTDGTVRQTIAKLPTTYLDLPDSRFGNTILMFCIQNGVLDLVSLLLQKGCDPNIPNYDGSIGLHLLCYPDSTLSLDVAQALIANGANVNISEKKYGCTPLHWAASAGNLALCQCLCNAGANPTICDLNGYDSFAYAKQSATDDCFNFLMNVSQTLSSYTAPPTNYEDPSWDDSCYNANASTVHFLSNPVEKLKIIRKDVSSAVQRDIHNAELTTGLAIVSNSPKTQEGSVENDLHHSRVNHTLEEELLFHLRTIEKKLNNNEESNHNDRYQRSGEHISELSNKLLQTQADLASKNMELLAMGFEAKSLREKYDLLALKTRPLVDVADKNFGESNVSLKDESSSPVEVSSKGEVIQEEIVELKRMLQDLELENAHLRDEKNQNEHNFFKRIADINNQLELLRAVAASKDLEISSLRDDLKQILRVTVDGNDNSKSEIEQSTLTSAQCKERLAHSTDEYESEILGFKIKVEHNAKTIEKLQEINSQNELKIIECEQNLSFERDRNKALEGKLAHSADETQALRCSFESEIVGLKTKVEYYSAKIKELEDKNKMNELSIIEYERNLSMERDRKTALDAELLAEHARKTEDIIKEKDSLLHKWKREFVILEDRYELAAIDLEKYRTKFLETDLKLQESFTLVHDAKIALAANEKLHRLLQVEADKRKALHNKLEDMKGRIRVYVRIRPMSSMEMEKGFKCAVRKDESKVNIIRQDDISNESRYWEFDRVFGGDHAEGNSQVDIFRDTSYLMTSVVDGYNVCIVAYGQTGSGKTYTMEGLGDTVQKSGTIDEGAGIATRSSVELFRILEEKETSHSFTVEVTVLELYNDSLKDLFVPGKGHNTETLRIKLAEHSDSGLVEVEGATRHRVTSAIELISVLKKGTAHRSTAATQMNADSSRSHLVTTIELALSHKKTSKLVRGKLMLVDLAGSERVGKSGVTGIQMKEAQSINKSLSALGDVVNALTSGSKHVPYRNHPLTMLMSDSIGGNSKTLIFICCSPVDNNISESSSSLDFGKRCKDVTNAILSPSNLQRQIKSLKTELDRLKQEKGSTVKRQSSS